MPKPMNSSGNHRESLTDCTDKGVIHGEKIRGCLVGHVKSKSDAPGNPRESKPARPFILVRANNVVFGVIHLRQVILPGQERVCQTAALSDPPVSRLSLFKRQHQVNHTLKCSATKQLKGRLLFDRLSLRERSSVPSGPRHIGQRCS